ncbi:hypothetical protein K470DRAFT_259345 [Piedraia hortae CBS 480.64]|uniref:PCI domain-containing protein n=1 Tax=Piedraia hortae CBS 480.64 TaxID=1314780 RepID=A0A6A7BUN8_9PEZI|nr:hypothetical protein K470DRAFT_259345 [Piedraia hortae CBS 480.64]
MTDVESSAKKARSQMSRPSGAPKGLDLPAPTFELESWAKNYQSEPNEQLLDTRPLLILRLCRVALHCPQLRQQALKMALATALSGRDPQLYQRVTGLASELGCEDISQVDTEWIAQTTSNNVREIGRKESELRGYKNNLIRESVRMGHADVAKEILATGGLSTETRGSQSGYQAAYDVFGCMRESCSTPSHLISMTIKMMYAALLISAFTPSSTTGTWTYVQTHASKLQTTNAKTDEQHQAMAAGGVALGLCHLAQKSYEDAAQAFVQTSTRYINMAPIHEVDFCHSIATANDVAVYGGLCALATFSRAKLAEMLNGPFRPFLELEPHVRKAISLFTTAKYEICLQLLERYRTDWKLDLWLGAGDKDTESRVDTLFKLIRQKCVTEYCRVFEDVSLSSLEAKFPPPEGVTMAGEIEMAILDGRVDAKLDLVNGRVIRKKLNRRNKAVEDALTEAAEIERTMRLRLHRVNVAIAGLEIV